MRQAQNGSLFGENGAPVGAKLLDLDPRWGGEMRILGLDTTEQTGSIAAAEDANLLKECRLSSDLRSAGSLAPAIGELLGQVGWKPCDVQLVAVTIGPGSFTGLRIGVTTAKAFAYAVGAEVLGIDTHETLASACPDDIRSLATVIDAQRGQVAARSFQRNGSGELLPQSNSELLDVDCWIATLAPGTRVTGPVLRRIAARFPAGVEPLARSSGIRRRGTWPDWPSVSTPRGAATISGSSCRFIRVRALRRRSVNEGRRKGQYGVVGSVRPRQGYAQPASFGRLVRVAVVFERRYAGGSAEPASFSIRTQR
jgi:tRNA threonylcarbamoyladenosine biosynthesis protein TsaB